MINLRHVGLIVQDIDKSYELYRDILGFIPKVDQIEKGNFYEHLTGLTSGVARTSKCYSSDGTCIEFIEYQSQKADRRDKGLTSEGFNPNDLTVAHLDSLHDKLISIGLEFINEPKLNPEKTAKVAFCRDFEGNFLGFIAIQIF